MAVMLGEERLFVGREDELHRLAVFAGDVLAGGVSGAFDAVL
ncbi:hypothetical protein [Streptomyces sp. NPDC126514]